MFRNPTGTRSRDHKHNCNPWWSVVKSPPANARDVFHPGVRNIPWGRRWQPTPVFLPRESHEQSSLVGYSPQGRTRSDMNSWLNAHINDTRWPEGRAGDLLSAQWHHQGNGRLKDSPVPMMQDCIFEHIIKSLISRPITSRTLQKPISESHNINVP